MPRAKKPEPPKPKRRSPGQGSVAIRGDRRIAVTLPPDLDPKRRPIYSPGNRQRFASVEEATAWLAAEVARRRSPPGPALTIDQSLGVYLNDWYTRSLELYQWRERTARAYRLSLQRWGPIAHYPLGALTRDVIADQIVALRRATWVRSRADGTPTSAPRPYSRRTIQHARSVLHQALGDLVPDVLPSNPAALPRRRARTAPEPEQPVWSAEQAERFLEVAERTEPRVALAFRLILRRALRTGEVVALTRADVNERAGVLTVDETAGPRRHQSGPPKTGRVRDVPLSADLVRRLRAHRLQYPTTDPHLFTVDGTRISLSYFRRLWHHCVRLAGVPAISPKDGRATCATVLLDQGWPLPRVAQLLGHASVATTASFYARTIRRRADQTAQLGEDIDATLERAAQQDADEAPAALREHADG